MLNKDKLLKDQILKEEGLLRDTLLVLVRAAKNAAFGSEKARDRVTASAAIWTSATMETLVESLERETARIIESNTKLGEKTRGLTIALIVVSIVNALIVALATWVAG